MKLMKLRIKRRARIQPWKNLLFGFAGGAVGTLTMAYYWKSVKAITGSDPRADMVQNPSGRLADIAVGARHYQEDEPPTEVLGRMAYSEIKGKEPDKPTRDKLGEAVHWTYGTLHGGLIGMLLGSKKIPEYPAALAYGTGMWLLGSEMAIPMLGLSKGPAAYGKRNHIYGIVAHWIYATQVANTRKILAKLCR